ncbi:MAG: hypothetical protein FWH26_06855 [Oscillospiraceae bacterium]|nr:hypothetical protein [Oscillospiraceae bacterium]
MNIYDYAVLTLLAAAAICAFIGMLRRKNRCGSGCGGCPYGGECGRKRKKSCGR